MTKKLFLLLLILVGINLNQSKAQNNMIPQIQLKGESKIKILPDLGILYIQINATAKTEAECNDRLNKLNDELMKNLSLIQAHLSDMKSKVDDALLVSGNWLFAMKVETYKFIILNQLYAALLV